MGEAQSNKPLHYEFEIQAPVEDVYRMFTNSSSLREWMCDTATVAPNGDGRFYVAWNDGYYAAGEYTAVQPPHLVEFTWRGKDEPDKSKVKVTLSPHGEGTKIIIVHSGIGEGGSWGNARQDIHIGWEAGIRNLKSVMEVGPDLRIVNRPMMGIFFGEFSAEVAKRLGCPVTEGVYVEGTIEGMGAQQAGLQKDDVIVELDGQPVASFAALGPILTAHEAGDRVKAVVFRNGEKKEFEMELSHRPVPDIPTTVAGLAQAVEKRQQEDILLLTQALEGVSDQEAAYKPDETQWSIKEILAHLIHSEREIQNRIEEIFLSADPQFDTFTDNLSERVKATAQVYSTLAEMVDALKCAKSETTAFIAALPESFANRKSSFWRLAFERLSFDTHYQEHADQIKEAVAAARK